MSATAELNATDVAVRLLPLLKEYAAKLADLSAQAAVSLQHFAHPGISFESVAVNAARLYCLWDTLDKPVTDVAREASGLIEHAALEYHLRGELKLRLDELEEHLRFVGILARELVGRITADKSEAKRLRHLIEMSGRYKAPF